MIRETMKVRVTFWDEIFYERSEDVEVEMSEQAYDELVKHLDGDYYYDGEIYYTADNKISLEIIG